MITRRGFMGLLWAAPFAVSGVRVSAMPAPAEFTKLWVDGEYYFFLKDRTVQIFKLEDHAALGSTVPTQTAL